MLNKKIMTASLVLLMIIATIPLITGGTSEANAQPPTPIIKSTTAYCGIIPESVGVNQEALIHLGIMSTTPGTAYSWDGLTVTVTKPDGTTQTNPMEQPKLWEHSKLIQQVEQVPLTHLLRLEPTVFKHTFQNKKFLHHTLTSIWAYFSHQDQLF